MLECVNDESLLSKTANIGLLPSVILINLTILDNNNDTQC